MFFRPAPKYSLGILVTYVHQIHQERYYLLIRTRRWVRLNNTKNKQWVYDGIILSAEGGEIKVSTYTWCVSEESIVGILGVE